jgi:peptidylprolyl isomerase
VATAALTALAGQAGEGGAARRAALLALKVDDVAVRGTALGLLKDKGLEPDVELIARAYPAMAGAEWVETRVEAVNAAAALGGAAALRLLQEATGDPFPAVRRAAGSGLARLSGQEPGPAPADGPPSSVALVAGRDYLSTAPRPRVRLETDRGTLVLELFREEAPRHVRSFLDLARAGFYDGLPFHRVVSGFVVQGLDPREDGWGTGGVFLRDEINPMPYLAGTLGMPNAGPDSGGCQIFITHVPTPHLDGAYTVFGRVVEGMDVLQRLDVGDRCRQVHVLPAE